jgi:hypothetical protein
MVVLALGLGFLILDYLPVLLFLAGMPIFITGIVLLIIDKIIIAINRKRKMTERYKLLFILAIIGIVLGISCTLPLFHHILFGEEFIDTGTRIHMETESQKGEWSKKYFIYNDRVYKSLDRIDASLYLEADEAVANYGNTSYIFRKILNFGDEKIIYTIKNCNDFSLLSTSNTPSKFDLYCDVDFLQEKKEYYENRDNYDYFISRTKNYSLSRKDNDEIVSRNISEADIAVLEKIEYNYTSEYINIPRKKCDHINVFGKSSDGTARRLFKHFLAINDVIYYIHMYDSDKVRVTKMNDEQTNYILELLK